jgi:hypothetical protein
MKKIVINDCYGGFSLSDQALKEYLTKINSESPCNRYNIPRDSQALIEVVEMMGVAADGDCAKLKIVEIPDDVLWEINEYDGMEWVAEQHRKWD